MRFVAFVAGLAVVAAPLRAQAVEYGSEADLKGILYIYVLAGEMKVRDEIADKLRKELPHLRVTSTPDEAEAAIVFANSESSVYLGTYGQSQGGGSATCYGAGGFVKCAAQGSGSAYSVPLYANQRDGRGVVVVPSKTGAGLRLVMEHSLRSAMLEKSPWSKFTDRFVKAYRQANPVPPQDHPPPSAELTEPVAVSAAPSTAAAVGTSGLSGLYRGDYTATIAPDARFEGTMQLVEHGEGVTGKLATSSGRAAEVTGTRSPNGLMLEFRFSDSCGGTASGAAAVVGSSLSGTYRITDCNGTYDGAFLLTRQ
jgi:hypothetical protein